MSAQNATEKGLPVNVDAERFVLGSILLDDNLYIQAAGGLEPDDFSLEKHRRIFRRMGDLNERGEGVSTGFLKLDEMTGGMHPGDLFILAARPSMGKTAFALNIAQHVSLRNKQTVAIFSLEMSKESLLTRMLCAAARVDSQKFRMGYLSQEERRKLSHALQELAEAPLYIDDTAGLHLMDMHAKLRRLKAERGKIGMVIV